MDVVLHLLVDRVWDFFFRAPCNGLRPSRGLPEHEWDSNDDDAVLVSRPAWHPLVKLAYVFEPATCMFTCPFTHASLFLGSAYNACDAGFFQRESIRHVVNVSRTIPPVQVGADVFRVPCRDVKGASLFFNAAHAFETIFYVHDHLCQGHSIFVHCQYGSSRSAAVVLLYLLWRHRGSTDLVKWYDSLQRTRPMIDINTDFLNQIFEISSVLHAVTHQLWIHPHPSAPAPTRPQNYGRPPSAAPRLLSG